tara:strand:- start:440 stop:646 length:207 start_codon:yes stop_codon:yes gene_type:complete
MSTSPLTGAGSGNFGQSSDIQTLSGFGFGLGNIGPLSGCGQYVGPPSNRGLHACAAAHHATAPIIQVA